MNTDNIREAFEAWYFDECVDFAERREVFQTFSNSEAYTNMAVADAWIGYQADHAASEKRIAELEADVKHWKNNHAHEVERARLIKNRTDVPLDRAKAYDRCALDKVEALQADNKRLVDFIEPLTKVGGEMVNGNRLSRAAKQAISPTESLEDK